MDKIVYEHFIRDPEAIAVVDDGSTLTYKDLVAESEILTCELRQIDIQPEEPIGIVLGPGSKQVVAQLGVLRAGGTCVPIDPSSTPPARVIDMLHDVNTRHVIMENQGESSSTVKLSLNHHDAVERNFHSVQIAELGKAKALPANDENPSISGNSKTRRSHILFTSGSSGKPKPVQISHQSIIHLATNTQITPLRQDDRVAEFNNPGFDLSIFEIWVPLLAGATIVVVPKLVVSDPTALAVFLRTWRVTVLSMPTALFEVTAFTFPATFQCLRHLITGGEVANKKAMRAVLDNGNPEHLWYAYGPTECTIFSTVILVTREETEKERVSIGTPVGKTEIYLLNDDLQPIQVEGQPGEICISGPGKSIGYLNRPLENERAFIQLRRSELDCVNGAEDGEEMLDLYRTGDVGTWTSIRDKCLAFLGRRDTQAKIGGFRVELGEVEHVILSHQEVKAAVAIAQEPIFPQGMSSLVAFVIAENSTLNTQSLSSFCQKKLPPYMLPSTYIMTSDFPLTPNGKVDRTALAKGHARRTKEQIAMQLQTVDKHSSLKNIWKRLLNIPNINDSDDFILLGGTSIQTAALIAAIKSDLGHVISMRDLHANSSLPAVVRLLERGEGQHNASDNSSILMADVNLTDKFELVPNWEADGHVFLTGATGFIGAHLLRALLLKKEVKQVACLVRSKGGETPAQRLQGCLAQYEIWPSSLDLIQKIILLDGDMSEDDLGLEEKKYEWLVNWASAVFHLGAKVNYCEPYSEHFKDNVLGTRNILQVAAQGRRKCFHYMSSLDAWGPTGNILGTRYVVEDGPLQPHLQSLRYDLGYSQSQWTAEEMVRRMRERGLPVTIYRPGFVIGDCQSGVNNPNDSFGRLIVGCIQIGSYPQVDMKMEWVTIDFVIPALVHIASSNANIGRSYHLVSPDPAESVDMEQTFAIVNAAGYPVKRLPYREWVREVEAKQIPDGPLAPLLPVIQEQVLGQLTRWEVGQYNPRYDAKNTIQALAGRPDIQYTRFNVDILKRYISFWDRKGHYKV